jgi:FkbM family methyltransferase
MPDSALKTHFRRLLPRGIRPHRILWGPLRGCWIVTSWHDYPGAIIGRTERPLLDWFEHNVSVGETWLDIGAHYGYTALALSRLVGRGGRVFAFEPHLATAGFLAQMRILNRLDQLTVIPCGLGARESLSLASLPAVRGMVDSTVACDGRWAESFLVAPLEWLWPRICGDRERFDGVKIDVQGMEIETLKGMAPLLAEFTPRLAVEVHDGVDRRELLDLIESVGYARGGEPVELRAGESTAQYLNDRSYSFKPRRRVTLDPALGK